MAGFPGGSADEEPTCLCRRHKRPVQSLGGEDPLEKEMTTHSSILAWKILASSTRGAWWATVHGVAKSDTTE